MIDQEALIRQWLVSESAITTLTGQRVYASTALPAGYKPTDGPALLFKIRGGRSDYSSRILRPSVQFEAYALTEALARQLAMALHDVINDQGYQKISIARLEVQPVPLQHPETQWPYILSFYVFHIQNPA